VFDLNKEILKMFDEYYHDNNKSTMMRQNFYGSNLGMWEATYKKIENDRMNKMIDEAKPIPF
jgi:alpha-galactosidase